eukprot:scaffold430488_cov48-Prasinocladus_malaysianus.AAC.1
MITWIFSNAIARTYQETNAVVEVTTRESNNRRSISRPSVADVVGDDCITFAVDVIAVADVVDDDVLVGRGGGGAAVRRSTISSTDLRIALWAHAEMLCFRYADALPGEARPAGGGLLQLLADG